MIPKVKIKIPKFELSPIKRFVFTYKRVLSIAYKVSPWLLIFVTVTNAFWGLTNLPILYINKILIDIVINNLGKPDLGNAIKTIVLLISLRALIEFIRSTLSNANRALSNSLTQEIHAYLENAYGQKLNSLDIPIVESPGFQDKYKKIEREGNDRLWGMIGPLSDMPNAFFTILSGIIPLLSFNPWLSIAVVLVTFPDIFLNSKLAKEDYKAIGILSPKWRLWGWTSYHLTNIRHFYENRILGNTKYLSNKLRKVQREILDFEYKRRMRRTYYRTFGSIPGYIMSLSLNSYFFVISLYGRISLGTAQLLYSATNTLSNGFSTLVNDAVSIYENYLFVSDLDWFLNLKSEYAEGKKNPQKLLNKGIEFQDVWFKYPNNDLWVLKGINFSIGPKENLALVGENGAGKTTIIKLLSGFYRPTKGRIFVDGVDIFDYKKDKYLELLGVLFQDFSEYPFSAKESIGIGDSSRILRLDEIKKAAKLTGVDDFIESLSLKYDTPLAKEFEKGVEPSKGQWQRIAIARILFRGSRILVLDEPTSNVDPQAEEEIFEKIIKLAREKILVLISHRFSTVRRADKIIVLDKGKIEESGSHEDLMKKKGLYAELFQIQARSYQ